MEKTIPLISVVVPVYNVQDYLSQCIGSLISQTLRDIEIILVNDGSTDNSGKLCDDYSKTDERIIVIHKDNGGLSDARNVGTDCANGEYLMYLDSDDWIEPDTCELSLTSALKNDADLVFWPYVKEYETTSRKRDSFFPEEMYFNKEDTKLLHRRITGLLNEELANPENADSFVSAWGKLYKRSIVVNNHLRFLNTSEIGTEDILFNFYYFRYVNSAVYINKHLNHYRKINTSSLSENHKSTLFSRWQKMFDIMELYIFRENLGQEFRLALNNRICLSMINLSLCEVNKRNNKTHYQKIKYLKNILKEQRYIYAFKSLKYEYFPIHWKIFFLFCQYRVASGVYSLALIMGLIRNKALI